MLRVKVIINNEDNNDNNDNNNDDNCNLFYFHAKPPISFFSLSLFGWFLKRKKKKMKKMMIMIIITIITMITIIIIPNLLVHDQRSGGIYL